MMVPRVNEALFTAATTKRYRISTIPGFMRKNSTELVSATVVMKENVVHAVLHSLAAETL